MDNKTMEVSADETPKKRGKPFNSETAKKAAISAAKAKKMRKEARAKMLSALTNDLDLGKELLKAMNDKDEKYLGMIEKATRLVGLQHDQSEEAIAQRISLDAKTDNRVSGNVNITVKGLDVD